MGHTYIMIFINELALAHTIIYHTLLWYGYSMIQCIVKVLILKL